MLVLPLWEHHILPSETDPEVDSSYNTVGPMTPPSRPPIGPVVRGLNLTGRILINKEKNETIHIKNETRPLKYIKMVSKCKIINIR